MLQQPADSYLVVVNDEEQFSIWPADQPVPAGWSVASSGTRESCLSYIEQVWVDMRPRSLREAMADGGL